MKRIAFILEDFALQTPAQQLLDRFLMGYLRDGRFHRLPDCQIVVHLIRAEGKAEFVLRKMNFGFVTEASLRAAVTQANAIVVVPRGVGATANEALLREVLETAAPDCGCFVYGVPGNSVDGARRINALAASRKISMLAGTPLPVTWRLPEIDLPRGTPLKQALIVVQGTALAAELDGLESLLPVIERRQGGEAGIRRLQLLQGEAIWRAGKSDQWSWPLLAAALSRSDTPQGDPVNDGRTQDLVRLGLVPKLARRPRAWLLEHHDGLRSAMLVLDGVVADYNFAVLAQDGTVVSAQLYRPPAPAQEQFSRLAAVVEDFFLTGKAPWPLDRNVLIAGLLNAFSKVSAHPGRFVATPELNLHYSV